MKKAKVIVGVIAAATMVMSLATTAFAAEEVTPAGDYKIGFSQATMASPFHVTILFPEGIFSNT